MLGGRQRRMYHIRDTKSRYYSEAYFILREDADIDCVCENDLAAEADRILREKSRGLSKKRRPRSFLAIMFLAGIVFGAVMTWAIGLVTV